jgi:hypothetical protein
MEGKMVETIYWICFLYFFQGPYAMLYAYMDESSTHQGAPVMCVGGLLYDRVGITAVNRVWKQELERAGIRYFHTVDYAHLRGEFEGKSRDIADKLYRKLVTVDTASTPFARSCACHCFCFLRGD